MADLCKKKDIEDQLRTVTDRIVTGPVVTDTNDVTIEDSAVEAIRVKAEAEITSRLSRFYTVPLSLSNETTATLLNQIATKLSAYNVWLAVHPTLSVEDLPAAVAQWKLDVDTKLDEIVPKGKSEPRSGRDIILAGETLVALAGDVGEAAFAITKKIPFGGTTS